MMYAIFSFYSEILQESSEANSEPSLHLLRSNLTSENVGILQSFVAKRCLAGKLNGFDTLKLIKDESDEVEYSLFYMDLEPSPSSKIPHRVVCLCDEDVRNMDLFRDELCQYVSEKLACAQDEEVQEEHFILPWQSECLDYLQRCIKFLANCLEAFISAVCLGYHVDYVGVSPACVRDLNMFHECLALFESSVPNPEKMIVLKFDNGEVSIDAPASIPGCHTLALQLAESNATPAHEIKSSILEFKMQVNQSLNQSRALLTQAEQDFYQLYQLFVFLQRCDYLPVLLEHTAFSQSLSGEQQRLLHFVDSLRLELCPAGDH